MTAIKQKAAQGLAPEAAQETTHKPNPTAWKYAVQAECGKQAAMAAYNWQVLSLDGCTRLFHRHPEWVSA